MNKSLIILCMGTLALSAGAQGKLDLGGKARVRNLTSNINLKNTQDNTQATRSSAQSEDPMVRAFITSSSPASTVSALEELGAVVDRTRGNIVMAQFPLSALGEVEALTSVKKIRVEQHVTQKMNLARPAIGVDKIHAGEKLPQAYTGKGVVAGIVDGGFDPNHINFLNSDGTSRIGQFTYFRSQQNSSDLLEERHGSDYIPNIDTENAMSFHATHTLGIMAGSYRGDIDVAVDLNNGTSEIRTMANPYYGIAYDADLATASAYQGQLSDYYIALGVESILDYAYAIKQPAVVNLSLGNNVGPHDGTSPICEYLDQVILDTQVNTHICVAAGNEGELPIAVTKTLTEGDTKVGTGIYPMYDGYITGYQNPRQGQFYIYSDTEEPFDIQIQVINSARNNRVAKRMVLEGSAEGGSRYWVSEDGYKQDDADIVDPQFGNYFCGYAGVGAEIDEVAKRYYAVVDMTVWDNVTGANPDGTYLIGIEVTGKPGQRIDIYGDGSMCSFKSYGVQGYSEGGFDGTISDIATGHNAVVVGSYNVRDTYAAMDGGIYGYNGRFATGEMSPFTSYGTLIDGRTLPEICAPGATLISSTSEYYLNEVELAGEVEQVSAVYDNGTRKYSYQQCSGTSMACPVVAGSIALWLEAYPELTAAQAKEIIRETAYKDEAVATSGNPAQWGWGKFDAYEGLKKVLELKESMGGVDGAVAEDSRLQIHQVAPRKYEVLIPGANKVNVEVYSVSGAKVASVSEQGYLATFDASGLAAGIYVVTANNMTSKIILR